MAAWQGIGAWMERFEAEGSLRVDNGDGPVRVVRPLWDAGPPPGPSHEALAAFEERLGDR